MARVNPTNVEFADQLSFFAALLELAKTSPFAVRAYERAAELARVAPTSVAELVRAGRVRELRGIGPGIEATLRALEQELAPELLSYGRLRGLSAKRIATIASGLGIRTVAELEEAVQAGRLREVRGIGPATEAKIVEALTQSVAAVRGLTLNRSRALSETIASALGGETAGAARRYSELAHELVVVCAAEAAGDLIARFERLPAVVTLTERHERGAVGLTLDGVPVRLVVARPGTFGTELVRATGAADWLAPLEPLPDAADEPALFAALGLPFCPPELRELRGAVPPVGLVERTHVRGDLHCHTTWSDGNATVREMALAARARGYDYLAICDHTPNVRVVPGLGSDDLRRQGKEIAIVNDEVTPFRVLRGVECDIRADGSLDADDGVLEELDWVQLSLHAGQRRGRAELTRVVTEAMRHPAVRALSHPKGRILNHRPENALDLDEVFAVAREAGVALEVNGLPDRIDLSAVHVREALAVGVDLVLSSDAHSTRGLDNLDLALMTARKGGAAASAVTNCRPLASLGV